MSPRLPCSFALLLGLGLLSSACSKPEGTSAPRPAGSPLPVTRDASPSRADSLDAFRTGYTRAYLLQPDARLTLALSTLDSLLTGKPPSPVEARFQDGQWTFTSQGQPLGSLPEFPTFAQASELLEARVKKLGTQGLALQTDEAVPAPAAGTKKPVRGKPQKVSKGAPKAAKAPKVSNKISKAPARKVRGKPPAATSEAAPAFTPLPLGLETLQQLHSLDQDWAAGKHSALRVKQAARALAALSFQLVDLTETADGVFARSLAHLALARAVTGEPLTEERLLLASSLGYAREAHALAQTLPAGTPLRLYALHEEGPLEALARGEREPGLAGYLWARRLPEVGTSERERRLGRLEEAPVPTLQELTTRLRVRDFDSDLALGSITPVLLLSEMAASAGTPDVDARVRGKPPRGKRDDALERKVQRLRARFGLDSRGLMPAFEQELARVGTAGGFFLDAETERAWFQGLLFSAEYRAGLFLLDSLASPEDAARYVKELGQADSPAGKEFLDWIHIEYRHL